MSLGLGPSEPRGSLGYLQGIVILESSYAPIFEVLQQSLSVATSGKNVAEDHDD
jgi:hypothetical protein